MLHIAYTDFDLLIHREGEGYCAQVLNSPAGRAGVAFTMPFPDLEAVFNGEVLGCLRSSLNEVSRQHAGLRIRQRLTDVPELADLAWEYLYNPVLSRFLALSVETPIVHYLDLPQSIRPLAVMPLLRVLVMISSPSDYPQLDVELEWGKLREALGDPEQQGLMALEGGEYLDVFYQIGLAADAPFDFFVDVFGRASEAEVESLARGSAVVREGRGRTSQSIRLIRME